LPTNYGYACVNMELSYPRDYGKPKNTKPITTNRSMIRKTFDAKGIKYASELALQNVMDLYKILEWNHKNNFNFYRLSSDILPWASEYKFEDMPDHDNIVKWLAKCGQFAKDTNQRLTSHPGPFNKLTSDEDRITNIAIRDLEIHAWIHDKLLLDQTPFAKINIHVGATYGNKEKACDNFCRNFDKLSDSVKNRLTVENDDKASLYSTLDLYNLIHKNIGIPIVFDYHHHKFCSGEQTEQDALALAVSTWNNIKPVVHYSESRSEEYNDPKIKPQAHSDFVKGLPNNYGFDIDVMVEAKMKEKAVSNALTKPVQ
jgi:UV DNA damage endonuclease